MNNNSIWTLNKTLELIETIKRRPCIYDTETKNHRNKKIVNNAWSDVDFAMKTPPGTSKEKYQLLRSAFRKSYLNGQKFPHYEKMKFLIPFLRPGNNPENSLQRCVERATAEYLKDNSDIFYTGEDSSPTNQEEKEIDEVEDYLLDTDSEEIAPSKETISKSNEESQPKVKIMVSSMDSRIQSTGKSHPTMLSIPEDSLIDVDKLRARLRLPFLSRKNSISSHERVQDIPVPKIENKQKDNEELENPVEYLIDSSNSEDDQTETLPNPRPKRKSKSEPEIKFAPKKIKNEILEPISSTSQIHTPVIPAAQQIYSPVQQPTCDCLTDPDAIFLRSLLDDMKTMNRKNKGLFKIKVQQVLQDILYPDD